MTDEELEAKLYPDEHYRTERPIPDMNFIHAELKRKGVTLQLLWQEYLEHYPNGLGHSQFCDYYLKWRGKREFSMHQIHKAGEKTYVDWIGPTFHKNSYHLDIDGPSFRGIEAKRRMESAKIIDETVSS